jgi:hypothetical protein
MRHSLGKQQSAAAAGVADVVDVAVVEIRVCEWWVRSQVAMTQ